MGWGGWGVVKGGHGGGEMWCEDCRVGRDRGTDWLVELRKGVEGHWYTNDDKDVIEM